METLTAAKFRFGEYELDCARRSLTRNGEPLTVNSKTFDLLQHLVENRGNVLSKDELLDRIWPGQFVEENNLTVQISTLRKVFAKRKGENSFIATVPGKGYSFVAEVDQVGGDEEIVVENRTVTRVVVDEYLEKRTENGHYPAAETKPDTALNRPTPSRTFRSLVIAGVVIFAALGFGAYVWQRERGVKSLGPLQQFSIKRLTTSGKVANAALSPDGKLFVYSSSSTKNLMLGHTAGGEPIELRPAADINYRSLNFSADGNTLYYVVSGKEYPTGTLFRIPVFGGVPEKLCENIRAAVTFAPDMSEYAYVKNDREKDMSTLFVRPVNCAPARPIASRPISRQFEGAAVAWSPDGKMIAAGAVDDGDEGENYEIFSASVADGQVSRITNRKFRSIQGLAWLADSSGLVTTASDQLQLEGQVWHLSYPDGVLRQINPDLNQHVWPIAISAAGDTLLSVQAEILSNIWVGPANDLSHARQITFSSIGGRNGRVGLDWMPDGRILYSAFVGNSHALWTMNADGSNQKQLTPNGAFEVNPSVTADGRTIVFGSNRSGAWEIWRVDADGSGLRQLTSGGYNEQSSVSPDGKWVVYISTRGGSRNIWRVPLEGGDPVKLNDRSSEWVRVSPDSKSIACRYDDNGKLKLAILSIDGGKPVKLFELPESANVRYALRWTPDGLGVSYRDWVSGYWIQPLAGGNARKMDDLPDEKLFASAWSSDGKQFAFARGQEIRDIVILQDLNTR